MTKADLLTLLKLDLESGNHSCDPMHLRIGKSLKKYILAGNVAEGEKLPSARNIAQVLGVARATVSRSLEDLISSGFVEAIHGSGCFVKSDSPLDLTSFRSARLVPASSVDLQKVLSDYGKKLLALPEERYDFCSPGFGGPILSLAPFPVWTDLIQKHCRFRDMSKLQFKESPFGFMPLREAFASYLIRTRAARLTAEQVVVFSARELRFDLILKLLLVPGDYVAVENPSYPRIRNRIASYDANVYGVDVDQEGLIVDQLIKLDPSPKIVYVTPSHHEPTGAVLSMSRRQALLAWASQKEVFIIEDDFDADYRYSGRALPSLQGMDTWGRVIHLSCFWKVLAPLSRLGFLVLPPGLIDLMKEAKSLVERDLPIVDQFALTDFINDGHLERYTRRARKLFATRLEAAEIVLRKVFANRIWLAPESAATDILIRIESSFSDVQIESIAGQLALELVSTHAYYLDGARRGEFLFPFANYAEAELETRLQRLADLL
ncbi:MAG: PLP-dependent aminotransferase family protein [Candidatus Obscuribacterales bacterium]|nr:PLP-dependent aminotransferase family protein [Candidatus Obscuribacterales bacterium]